MGLDRPYLGNPIFMGLSHIYGIIVDPHRSGFKLPSIPMRIVWVVPLDQKKLGVKRRPMRTGIKVDDDDLPILESENNP